MKVSLATGNLQKTLALVNHGISSRSQLAILLNILLEAHGQILRISSTDLEIGIQAEVSAEIEEEGSVTVPAKTFIELINSLPQEQVIITTKENTAEVVSKKTKSILQTTPAADFPKLYDDKGTLVAVFDTQTLKKDFGCVIFAASQDTARPALSGVLVKKEATGFLLVATDGYRLSLKHYQSKSEQEASKQHGERALIIPARVFREVITAKEEGGEVKLYVSPEKNQVLFALSHAVIIGRLIEAEFPKYERIIPSDYASRIGFDREELQKAVRICSIFARDAANIVKLSLRKEKIVVSSQTPSVGENTVDVDADLSGEENEIAFNAKYLLDILSNVEEENLVFEMSGPLNPGVFRFKDDTSFLHLIMPIRVQQ